MSSIHLLLGPVDNESRNGLQFLFFLLLFVSHFALTRTLTVFNHDLISNSYCEIATECKSA